VLNCVAILLVFAISDATTAEENSTVAPGAARGFVPSLVYNGAAFANARGGVRTGATHTSNLNVQVDIDANALLGWTDTIAYIDGLWLQGGLPSNLVGDAQGVSNISARTA
jgi:porin